MIRNYLKIAWRNITTHKFHSVLNIIGLSIGISFTLLVLAYVWGEFQVNRTLADADRQYIIQSKWKNPDMGLAITTVGPLAKTLKEEYPGLVENYYRWDGITSNVAHNGKVFREGLQIGDSTLLDMYGFKVLYGDRRKALNEPFTTVISDEAAIKYFGKKDVVGENLTIESFSGSKHDFKITAVIEKPAYTSVNRVTFDNNNQVFIPVASIAYFNRNVDSWSNAYIVGFLKLKKGVHPKDLEGPMKQILQRQGDPVIAANMQPYLVALNDYYLTQNDKTVLKMLYTVSFIALFILLMAIINFVNISIGNAGTRLKEIGIRKVMGGVRRQLIYRFLSESVLLVSFSMIMALVAYHFLLPFASDIMGKQLPGLNDFPSYYLPVPVVLVLLIGLLSGLYPALLLSGLKAVDLVKGKLRSVQSGVYLRKSLVGFQFFTAAVVLAGAIILGKQVALFFSDALGYDKDYVVSVQTPRDWTEKGVSRMQAVRDEFKKLPEISNATLTWSVPDGTGIGTNLMYPEGKDSTQAMPFESIIGDENYLDAFHIPVVAGRPLQSMADSANIVVNETAVRTLGYKSNTDILNTHLYQSGTTPVTIVGVIKDFHFSSMRDKIKPFIMMHVDLNKVYRLLCFKLKGGNIGQTMEALQRKWNSLLPGTAFEYKFMDESLQKVYRTELQLKKASGIATVLAIIIVVLGIVGLISQSIQKRTKEMGIRKVLGASVTHITSLFVKDFLPVLAISSLVAIPVAWYLMSSWLNDYSYRVSITALPFLVTIISLFLITVLLIGLQTIKLAVSKPAQSLRSE